MHLRPAPPRRTCSIDPNRRRERNDHAPSLKRYDRAYFDRWYRNPRSRVITPAAIARKAHLVVSVAEYFMGTRVRSVLDVGCGEGAWYRALKKLRPSIQYLGIDPSPYVVERYGRRRNIRLGSFGDVAEHADGASFDMIISSDVMQYVPAAELRRGLLAIAEHLGGVAYLEAHTVEDEMDGDMRGWHRRTARYYRRLLSDVGLLACGPHCYLGEPLHPMANALEVLRR